MNSQTVGRYAMVLIGVAIVGCSAVTQPPVSPPPSPTPSSTPSPSPSSTSSELPIATPTSPSTPAPAESIPPSPASSELHWQQIGTVGGPDFRRGEYDELVALIGFDAGYLAFERIVGSEDQWANRIWFSSDGSEWEDVTPTGSEITLGHSAVERSVATNGREVLMIARSPHVGSAWLTADGRHWQETAPDLMPERDWAALAVWPITAGWQALFYESYERDCDNDFYGCFRTTVWQSPDGVTWQRLSTVSRDDSDEAAGAAHEDGTTVVAAGYHRLVKSLDGGLTWDPLGNADGCLMRSATVVVRPSPPTVVQWLIADSPFEGGGVQVCTSPGDLATWHRASLPTTSSINRLDVIWTGHGYLLSARRWCEEPPGCPPNVEQYVSAEGQSWTAIDSAVADLGDATDMHLSDGPAGVIGLATYGFSPRVPGYSTVSAFRLAGGD